jgi:UDP-2-acetamido-2-deoxy-ribo-hexuluronate aminotransferase
MKIDFANLQHQYQLYKTDIDANIQSVLNKSNYIMGEEVSSLETELKNFTQAKYAVTCSNGTDALLLAMMAMDIQPGDEIITTPFSYIATAETIAVMKATPVFVDIDQSFNIDTSKIELAITSKTKAIMPVSLYGQPADLTEINKIAQYHGLKVIVDGAQSFGATYKGQSEVHSCDIYTTSFFPAKPLGCYGDGGAVFTNNDEYAEKMSLMRVHGQSKRYHHKYIGMGGRLDTIQAAVLLAKLPHYSQEIIGRSHVADQYSQLLGGAVQAPLIEGDRTTVWAQYTVRTRNRDEVQGQLKLKGVPTAVHYPMPLHMQECFKYLGLDRGTYPEAEAAAKEVMSLPMNPFLTNEETDYIGKKLIESVGLCMSN